MSVSAFHGELEPHTIDSNSSIVMDWRTIAESAQSLARERTRGKDPEMVSEGLTF